MRFTSEGICHPDIDNATAAGGRSSHPSTRYAFPRRAGSVPRLWSFRLINTPPAVGRVVIFQSTSAGASTRGFESCMSGSVAPVCAVSQPAVMTAAAASLKMDMA